ncbi:hypothetical protein, partial [Streptomyces mirabilis]|uniref:hypothetical protein n=1 Tax=Streptomyces mirabilis TaxID=68239 RepID=UPI0033CD503A
KFEQVVGAGPTSQAQDWRRFLNAQVKLAPSGVVVLEGATSACPSPRGGVTLTVAWAVHLLIGHGGWSGSPGVRR